MELLKKGPPYIASGTSYDYLCRLFPATDHLFLLRGRVGTVHQAWRLLTELKLHKRAA